MSQNCNIPEVISDNEKLLRVLFHPIFVTKDGQKVKPKAFRSPHSKDEVSVTRLHYSIPDICKRQALTMRRSKDTYFGFAIINTIEVRELDANVIYSPSKKNIAHADIKIGYVSEKGQPLPARYSFKLGQMAKKARLYKDPNPNLTEWNGEELI